MNDNIQHIIQEIRMKKNAMSDLLNQQNIKTSELEVQIEQLTSALLEKDTQLSTLNETIQTLKNEKNSLEKLVEETKNQVIEHSSTTKNDEEIDELVREIEYCIDQLKK